MDNVCSNCNGEGSFPVDKSGPGREHYTEQVPCPDCKGSGEDASAETMQEIESELAGPLAVPPEMYELRALSWE